MPQWATGLAKTIGGAGQPQAPAAPQQYGGGGGYYNTPPQPNPYTPPGYFGGGVNPSNPMIFSYQQTPQYAQPYDIVPQNYRIPRQQPPR